MFAEVKQVPGPDGAVKVRLTFWEAKHGGRPRGGVEYPDPAPVPRVIAVHGQLTTPELAPARMALVRESLSLLGVEERPMERTS